MSHKHDIKKTHISFVEFDDVDHTKLAINKNYFGEGNSLGRRLEFDFEYCLGCNMRLINSQRALTRGILEDELEIYVTQAKKGSYIGAKEITIQHSDFEVLGRLIEKALAFGKMANNDL